MRNVERDIKRKVETASVGMVYRNVKAGDMTLWRYHARQLGRKIKSRFNLRTGLRDVECGRFVK